MPVDLFDQNGYDLTNIEQSYYSKNKLYVTTHRNHDHNALKYEWYIDIDNTIRGAHLNHCLLFERKGFTDEAYLQLKEWAEQYPILNKICYIRPKWGFDLSIDYSDHDGAFEVFHYEYDGFDYDHIVEHQKRVEEIIENTDWNDAAKSLLKRKAEWHNLDFFGQSTWKCTFFGLPPERFKEVIWQ
jgi:hypothetical protein